MATIRDFMVDFSQTARRRLKELSFHGRGWAVTNWGLGSMLGLSAPASISIGNSEVPTIISVGALLGFAAGAVKYASQNWDKIKQFGPSTALALLAVTLTLLHGVTSWIPVLRWIPIWTSLTLLGSVNVAPRVIQTITTLGAGFSAIIEIGIRSRTGLVQEMDLEETVVLLQEMAEGPNTGYQGPDAFEFLLGHMNHPPEAVDPELGEENPDSLQLDSGSVSTRSDVRQILQNLNQMPNQVSQDTAFASLGTVPEQNGTFPQAPQDQLFEMPLIRSVPSSRTEESLVHMLPG